MKPSNLHLLASLIYQPFKRLTGGLREVKLESFDFCLVVNERAAVYFFFLSFLFAIFRHGGRLLWLPSSIDTKETQGRLRLYTLVYLTGCAKTCFS